MVLCFLWLMQRSRIARVSWSTSLLIVWTLGLTNALLLVNWRISAKVNNTCEFENTGCELHIDFTGRRPGLVIFAALVAVIVNWALTISIFLLTSESVIMRRSYIFAVGAFIYSLT
jgi:hypothetical protein